MVVKIKNEAIQAPKPNSKFTIQDVEKFFKIDDWNSFYKKHESKFWAKNLNVYDWVCYPCIYKDTDDHGNQWYRCTVHETVIAKTGDKKPYTFFLKNVYFESLVAHMLDYEPEKHKKYITEKLFGINNVRTDT